MHSILSTGFHLISLRDSIIFSCIYLFKTNDCSLLWILPQDFSEDEDSYLKLISLCVFDVSGVVKEWDLTKK